jgi:hypothetical protein
MKGWRNLLGKFPGNGRVSGCTEEAEGRASIEAASVGANRIEKAQELPHPNNGSSAPSAPLPSPRIVECDFMSMLRDPEMEQRAERSARMQ